MNVENRQASAFNVLALGASAGGHAAIATILQQLPPDFSVPILVIQHLAADSTTTDEFYRRLVPFAVEWVQRDYALSPGLVLLCPPRSFVDLLPDGSLVLSPNEQGTQNKPIDHLFESVARSFGPHAIGVILTGMGADGALGARALHLAGGKVLVQSEASAEFPNMPRAAIQAGAADIVAPLEDLGEVIGEIVAGAARPQPRSEIEAIRHTFGEKSAVAAQAREIDWWSHPLGPVHRWPTQLREFVRMAVEYMDPAQLIWGEEQLVFFNDAAIPSYGSRWTHAFARPFPTAFPDAAEAGDIYARVLAGEHVRLEGRRFAHVRSGQVMDAWFDVVHNPVYGPTGKVLGSFNVWYERTEAVLAARRLHAINRLATAPPAANRRAAIAETLALLQESADVPFAAAYLVDEARRQVLLGGAFGVEAGGDLAPHQLSIRAQEEPWPLATVMDEGRTVVVEGLAAQFHGQFVRHTGLTPAPWINSGVEPVFNSALETAPDNGPGTSQDAVPNTAPNTAVIHPLRDEVEKRVIGALVLGTNPRLLLDDDYRAFLTLAAETIEAKVAESHAQERERERLTQLAELDRAKTDFFANVSHEFRTPITLMLAPLEDLLRQGEAMPPQLIKEVEVAAANAHRLLRLVNSLLDFSQIDARRQQPNFEPVDLCALTADIASAFRSAVEAAGLTFRVDCDPNLPPVWIDREMWEKIVSNLLSNAFKFTFEGEIAVEVRALSLHAELTVLDTGIGIPEQELPNLFKRFHRVRGARARTVEGAGIGLAIVEELVNRMGGQLTVRSREHRGSSFTIWIPYKTVRNRGDAAPLVAADPVNPLALSPAATNPAATTPVATELAKDASRWLVDGGTSPSGVIEDLLGPPSAVEGRAVENIRRGRLLVADDNADLRAYLQRLLSLRWEVELASDGETALAAASRRPPAAILADVMMPGLDGFELIQHMRAVPQLAHTPVILLTARTGEEAAIQGLRAGADDFVAKPFSPRELVARIEAVVDRARAQAALREAEEKHRAELEDEVRQRIAELRHAEEFLQATLDSSPYIVQAFKAVRDESGQIVDFVWVFNNRAGYRQNGDVIGKSLLQQNPGVVATGLFAKFVEVTETGAVYNHEQFYDHEQFDGWFHQTLVKLGDGFVMNTEDITDRKRAEAAAKSPSTRETQA